MKETTFIYALIDPITKDIRYIGKSNNPDRRFREHLSETKHINTHKYRWIKKLLKNGLIPILEIIDEVGLDCWEFWEIFYHKLFKDYGCKLTNMASCGYGVSKHHPETIELLKQISNKREYVPLSKEKLKIATEKRINTLKIKYPNGTNIKTIFKIDINTNNVIDKYYSAREAAKANNISNKRFTEILAGYKNFGNGVIKQVKQHKGFRYIREEDYDPNKDYRVNPRRSTPIQQLTLEGELIKEFDRVKEASEELNIPAAQIVNCAKGNQKTCKGFIFKYTENN